MKKTIYIIAALASVLTACNNGITTGDENFTITVSNIKDREAKIRIVPSDTKAYYYWDIVTEQWFSEHKDSLGEYYKRQWDEDIRLGIYEYEGEEGEEDREEDDDEELGVGATGEITIEYFMYQGVETEELDDLRPETEYVVFAYYPDADFHAAQITTNTIQTAKAELLNDMMVWFVPYKSNLNISLSLVAHDELFFGSVPTAQLGSTPLEQYAEQYFSNNIGNIRANDPEGVLFVQTSVPIPEEETEWFACTYINKSRTSKWFFYHTPVK